MKESKYNFKRIFFISLALGALVLGAFYVYAFLSARGASIELVPEKNEVRIGEPFDLTVLFSNNSRTVFNDVSLTIEAPEGLILLGSGDEKIAHRPLGEIGRGGTHREIFRVMAISAEN